MTKYEAGQAHYTDAGMSFLTAEEAASMNAVADEVEAQKAADKEAAKGISDYDKYIEQTAKLDDEDDAQDIVKAMRKAHDAICNELYLADDKAAIAVHVAAFDTAKKAIMASYKRPVQRMTQSEAARFQAACQMAERDEN